MLSLILTLIAVAVLLYGFLKNYNTQLWLLGLPFIILTVYSLATGTSVLGDSSCGNIFLDMFEYMNQTAVSVMGKTVLLIMVVMGYVSYMEHLKASTLFAVYLSKPIKKLKNTYVIVAAVIVAGILLKLVIASASSLAVMLLGIMYPILRAMGISKPTCCTALLLGGMVVWGTNDAVLVYGWNLAGITDMSIAEFFVKYQIPMVAIVAVVFAITAPIMSKYYDKKEGYSDVKEEIEALDSSNIDIPKFYALFPLMPLVFAILFSSIGIKTVTMSLVGVHLLSVFIVIICEIIRKKGNVKQVYDEAQTFFDGMGNYIKRSAFLYVGGTMLSAAINAIGGVTFIANILTSGSNGYAITLIVASVLSFIIAAFSYMMPTLQIFVPLFVAVCARTGGDIKIMMLCLLTCAGLGQGFMPALTSRLIVSSATEVPITTMLKRDAVPLVSGLIVAIVYCLILAA